MKSFSLVGSIAVVIHGNTVLGVPKIMIILLEKQVGLLTLYR